LAPGDPLRKPLCEYGAALLDALTSLESYVFHMELFHDEARRHVSLCEIGCRPGGGSTVDMVETAFGPNLARVQLRFQLGLDPLPEYLLPDHSGGSWRDLLPRRPVAGLEVTAPVGGLLLRQPHLPTPFELGMNMLRFKMAPGEDAKAPGKAFAQGIVTAP